MNSPTRYSIVIANSLENAVNNAINTWKWKQTAVAWFITQDGEEVRWAQEDQTGEWCLRLHGGTRLYVGRSWNLRKDKYHIIRAVRTGRMIVIKTAPDCELVTA